MPYELFGRTFEPASPATWAIPIVLLALGGGLLQPARRITARAWLAATQEVPGDPPHPLRRLRQPHLARSGGRPGSVVMSVQLAQPGAPVLELKASGSRSARPRSSAASISP